MGKEQKCPHNSVLQLLYKASNLNNQNHYFQHNLYLKQCHRSNKNNNIDHSTTSYSVSSIKPGMSWTGGDWMCNACQHINFKKRDACQRCGYPKFGGPDPSTYAYNSTEVLAGDWYCTTINCGAHNYASRTSCYRCGALKNDYTCGYGSYLSDPSVHPGWKTGDWICTRIGCGVHNYASRSECFKCRTQREYGSTN